MSDQEFKGLVHPMVKRISKGECSQNLSKKVKSETKITDLNFYCLRPIFQYLGTEDTIKLATLNDKFIEPSDLMEKQKKQQATISYKSKNLITDLDLVPESGVVLVTMDLWNSPRTLSDFGQWMTKVSVDFGSIGESSSLTVEGDILNCCSNLTELELVNCRNGAFENISEPFERVKVFRFHNGILGPKFSELRKWFPNLKILSLECEVRDKSSVRENLAKRFLCLDSLSLKLTTKLPKSEKNSSVRAVILKSNDWLSSVTLNFEIKAGDLVLLSRNNELRTLEFHISPQQFKKRTRQLDFEKLKKLVLKINNEKPCDEALCPMKFRYLSEFELTSDRFIEPWIFFEDTSLNKFEWDSKGFCPDMELLMKIPKIWWNLNVVTLNMSDRKADEIIAFINAFNFLLRLNVMNSSLPSQLQQFEEVKTKLSSTKFEVVQDEKEFLYSIARKKVSFQV